MKINPTFGIENSILKPLSNNKPTESSFQNILNDAISQTEQAEKANTKSTVDLLSGDVNDLHTAMLDMDKADISLRFTMQIRNKMLEAYNEVMRMQV